jgi:transmembrane sensor
MTGAERDDLELDPLKREAIAWVQRLTSGRATAADADALKHWRNTSPDHAAAFASARLLWRDLEDAGQNLRRREREATVAHTARGNVLLGRRAFLGGGLLAASVVGAYAVVRPPLDLWPSLNELSADYRTGTGEQRNLALSDEIAIRMNTRTSIVRQSSEKGVDKVKLIAGEASFSTAQQGRILSVLAADSEISAVTAQFDVSYLHDGDSGAVVCATCLQGELKVQRGDETSVVGSGQQLRYDRSGAKQIRTIDPEVAAAWHQGVLIFRFTPLAEVVSEVNRYRPGRIVVMNAQIGRVPVSGRFRITRLDDILVQFEHAFGARLRTLPGGVVLLS